MAKHKGIKNEGRTTDMSFQWFTNNYGAQWEAWRSYGETWIRGQEKGVTHKLGALVKFFDKYLQLIPQGHDVDYFFSQESTVPDLYSVIKETVSSTHKTKQQNVVVDFIDWIIAEHYSEPNDNGSLVPLVTNPFSKKQKERINTETVHNPLPYTYIKELRQILCPNEHGHFRDWTWAQRATGHSAIGSQGDWREVDPEFIDRSDPDCVWRERIVQPGQYKTINGIRVRLSEPLSIHEIWSPVRSMALFIKLHLPLRTYQVRFLDSGEADTWRYQQGQWILNNKHDFVLGKERNPWSRGVFRRIRSHEIGEIMTGLYINTNKTADQNKESIARGYTIPWQHEVVLYWLEKLRNWQEKYNPISAPTPCTELQNKHFGGAKSTKQKVDMGEISFLFRDDTAKANEKHKPLSSTTLYVLWYRLLNQLEENVAERGQTLSDGSRLRFVDPYPDWTYRDGPKTKVEFPLHSLRVSLLTCYAMEGSVPMPVLSKLIAGHSRLLMTIYYTKLTPTMMAEAMEKAGSRIEASEQGSLRTFLKDAELRQIHCKTVYRDEDSINAALANRNPLGWEYRHHGLCLVGGNTVKSDEVSTVGGCWNGGECLASRGSSGSIYAPVPHGPENCVRCRWFITDARYLDTLRAHFNNISYQASQAANLALEVEQVRDDLLDERYFAQEAGLPFTKQAELQQIERRYEKQVVEADEYAKDLVACFQLVSRIIEIEEGREVGDDRTKLVAVGSMEDIHQPISFIETDSEMFQVAQICDDAELYPELADEIRKTPAVEKRSRQLNRLLMSQGYSPVFMHMDDRMQLIAGNAMIRAMAQKASSDKLEGFKHVTGVLEAGQHLNLLSDGVYALEEALQSPVLKLHDIIKVSNETGALIHESN